MKKISAKHSLLLVKLIDLSASRIEGDSDKCINVKRKLCFLNGHCGKLVFSQQVTTLGMKVAVCTDQFMIMPLLLIKIMGVLCSCSHNQIIALNGIRDTTIHNIVFTILKLVPSLSLIGASVSHG